MWYVVLYPRQMHASKPCMSKPCMRKPVYVQDIVVHVQPVANTNNSTAKNTGNAGNEPTGWYEGVPVYMYDDLWDPRDTSYVHLHADDPLSQPPFIFNKDTRVQHSNFDNNRIARRTLG